MKKRIFVAIPAGDHLKNQIELWQNKNLSDLPVRSTKPKNLHLTLIPPWYEKDIKNIKEALEDLKLDPFSIKFNQIEPGPNKNNPRLIWAVGQKSEDLSNLKQVLESKLNKQTQGRKMIPHVTIARFKSKDIRDLPQNKLNQKIKWEMKIDRITVFESRLSKHGADYTPLYRVRSN